MSATDRSRAWQRETLVQISTGDSPFVPEIVADRGGAVHMAWGQDGSICYRQYANGALSGIDCSVGYYEGLQTPSIAVSPSGAVYIAWNRANLAEIWQNARVNGLWGDPERLGADSDSGFRTRFQRYGVAFDGEVDLAFIQNGVTRFHQVTPGSRDRQGPTATDLTLAAAADRQPARRRRRQPDRHRRGGRPLRRQDHPVQPRRHQLCHRQDPAHAPGRA